MSLDLNSLSIVPQFFLNFSLLSGVGGLPVPLPILQCPLPRGSTGSIQHGWTILDSLLIHKLLLVTRLPVVDCLAVLDSVHIVALLHVPATLDLGWTMNNSITIFELNSLSCQAPFSYTNS